MSVSIAEFERDHPGVAISPPGDGYGDWIARQGGMILAADREPGALLAVLEVLLGP